MFGRTRRFLLVGANAKQDGPLDLLLPATGHQASNKLCNSHWKSLANILLKWTRWLTMLRNTSQSPFSARKSLGEDMNDDKLQRLKAQSVCVTLRLLETG